MSQKQNKRDRYIFKILKYCYFRIRTQLIEKSHYSYLFNITGLLSQFPVEDKIFTLAALKKLINLGYLDQKNSHFVELSPSGVLFYEQEFKPVGIIHFSTLIFPFLKICYNLLENNDRIDNIDDFIQKLEEEEDIILKENEHWEVLHILHNFGWIRIMEGLGGFMDFQNITPEGINYLLDNTPPDIIETNINANVIKFLNLDYFPKEIENIKILLYKWLEQFSDGIDKRVAVFLIRNLWIIQNQWCIDKFNEFYEKKLSSINVEDIYIFPAGKSGSSAEYWRHKFVRELYDGKEISRTLKTFEIESQQDFWDGKVILFVDDLVGSGDQFSDFLEKYLLETSNLQVRFKNSRIIYFTPIATEFGIGEISKKLTGRIELFHGTILKKLFDDDNPIWDKSTLIPKSKIEEICMKYGKNLQLPNESILGYNDSQLLIGFQDHTPDNTIPILWFMSNKWTRLLKR